MSQERLSPPPERLFETIRILHTFSPDTYSSREFDMVLDPPINPKSSYRDKNLTVTFSRIKTPEVEHNELNEYYQLFLKSVDPATGNREGLSVTVTIDGRGRGEQEQRDIIFPLLRSNKTHSVSGVPDVPTFIERVFETRPEEVILTETTPFTDREGTRWSLFTTTVAELISDTSLVEMTTSHLIPEGDVENSMAIEFTDGIFNKFSKEESSRYADYTISEVASLLQDAVSHLTDPDDDKPTQN